MTFRSENILQVAKLETPKSSRPWFLIETFITSDGVRSRICDGRWATFEEAEKVRQLKQEARYKETENGS